MVVIRADGAEPADGDLVRRVRAGDEWAEEALYRRHSARIHAMAMRLLGRRPDAEDVLQDSFVAAFQRLAELREPDRFGPWLLTIAVRLVYQVLRRRRLRRLIGLDRDGSGDVSLAPAASVSPEQRAQIAELEKVVSRLPAQQRVPWTLHHVEGLTLEEVAAACGCSLATVKRRIAAVHQIVRRTVDIGEVP